MATASRIRVNPDVIKWARITAKLDLDTAAQRIGVRPGRVLEWESGVVDPTINQLRSMSDAYQRPLAALFLPEPLESEQLRELPDYRRRETRESTNPAVLQKAIMRAYRQQDALREIAADLDTPEEDRFASFSLSFDDPAEVLAEKLRRVLGLDSIARGTIARPEELLRALVRQSEALGVTVTQVQRVPIRTMRGFSLAEGTFPVIALNGADWPRGKIYSLLHELAHVGFRTSGICDLEHDQDPKVERLCESVAAATLMPRAMFLAQLGMLRGDRIDASIAAAVGNAFGASGEAAVLRMVELGRADWDDYWRLKPDFEELYSRFRADQRQSSAENPPPIFYQLKARDLGRHFIQVVLQAYGNDALSSRDLVQLLEVSYDKIPKLVGVLGDVSV